MLGLGAPPAEARPSRPAVAKKAPVKRAASPVNSAVLYTIRKGDTLSAIAARHAISMASIATVNGINNKHRIVAGAQILIPVNSTQASPRRTAAAKVTTKTANLRGSALPAYRPSPGQPAPARLAGRPDYRRMRSAFQSAANTHDLPVELLMSVAWQESGWQNRVVSKTGAMGVGQLMPDTVTFVNEALVRKPMNPSNPTQNIHMSAAFLKYLLRETNGDQRLALAAYYQGLGSVRRIGLYGETHQYVRNVLAVQNRWF